MASSVPGQGWSTTAPVFQLGKGKTLAIPMTIHAASRIKIRGNFDKQGIKNGICLLRGGVESTQYDTDTEPLFRYVCINNVQSFVFLELIP